MSNNKIQYFLTEIYKELKIYAISRCGINISDDMVHKTIEYILKNQDRLEHEINNVQHLLSYSKLKLKNEYKDYLKATNRFDQFKEIDPEGDIENYEFEINESLTFENNLSQSDPMQYIDLHKAMSKLTASCRELLIMKSNGYTPNEIAEKLMLTVGTVGSRSTRCLESLREFYNA